MKVFCFAPVLRQGSYNKKLIRVCAGILEKIPHLEIELSEFNDFSIPVFDGDIEAQGIPEDVRKLGQKIMEADAVLISSPEYNGSIPGPFKNAIDWLSRLDPVPLEKKIIGLVGASPGQLGAVRGNLHIRVPLHVIGSYVYPEYYGLAQADKAFDPKDQLKDSQQIERLTKFLNGFLEYMSRQDSSFSRLKTFLEEQISSHPHH
ncbi:MAG: NADPH-dependent FMN reductase [Bdellovibrio sp.]